MRVLLANPDEVIFMGTEIETTNYNNKPGERKFLQLKTSVSLGSVRCSDEAFAMAANIKPMTRVNFVGDFDDRFKMFRITAIKAVE